MSEIFDISRFDSYREDNRREVKKAHDGLPVSLWDTYSAFANCYGGIIILGVKENPDGSWRTTGLKNAAKLQKEFWDIINNTNKVSINLLRENDVETYEYNGDVIMTIHVPAARREQKPVYINNDMFNGTFRRNYEGDYHCTTIQVKTMLRDQADDTVDMSILDSIGLEIFNADSVRGYRNTFASLKDGHPFVRLDDNEFLRSIGAAAISNKDNALHPTAAGLLMFGNEYDIVRQFPNYFLDYREECDDKAVRWLFRTHSNEGDWSGNIYDFFCKIRTRMDDDIAVPFANRRDGYRVDRVDVHDALEEALANALAHANYYGRRGIIIIKKGKELSISNPGTIRVTKEEFYAGGNSDPRNPNILKMFGFVNVGERAGSGVDKIMTAWAEQNWKKPEFDFSERNDRVTLKLEVGQVVYIPGVADIRNKTDRSEIEPTKDMSKEDKILGYIRINGGISTKKVMEICNYNSRTGARKLIDKMIKADLIEKIGERNNTFYKIKE